MQVVKGVPARLGVVKGALARLGAMKGALGRLRAVKDLPLQAWRSVTRIRPPQTWEGWAVLALLVLGLGTRLWDLGGRALHYDEILHAWYSWLYAKDFNYAHNPLTHGPLLYHAGAATYKLIGSSEFAARLAPALFGAALVVMPWLFRKELGRYGALSASLFLLVSPTVLYFGRFMRNDIYMAFWAVALLAVALRYMERPRLGLLFAWALLWALTFASKESAFFLVGMFGLLLLARAAPALVEWVRNLRPLSATGPAADLLIVMGTLTLPMWAPVTGLVQDVFGFILVNPDGNHPLVQSGELFRADEPTGAPVGGAKYIAGFIVLSLAAVSVMLGMTWNRRRWPLLFGTFAAAWLLLFTSFFSNWQGFFTGFWGSLGYWVAQQSVERANQPWYYYMIGLSVYEFAIVVPTLIGSVYLLARHRNTFDMAIVGWVWLSFGIYSFAGERMPWLLTGIAVPCAFVAGRVAGMLAEHAATSVRTIRAVATAYAGSIVLGAVVPFLAIRLILADEPIRLEALLAGLGSVIVAVALISAFRPGGMRTEGLSPLSSTAPVIPTAPLFELAENRAERRRAARGERQRRPGGSILQVLTAILLGVLRLIARVLHAIASPFAGISPQVALLALGFLTTALCMTVFISARASYSYEGFERPRELLVYSQTGQETPYAVECIERFTESAGFTRENIRILADEHDNFAWQWRWYLRDYPWVTYRTLNTDPVTEPPDEPLVMMSIWSEDANKEHLGNYTRLGELHTLWWYPNYAYSDLTPAAVFSGATSSEGWRTVVDYQLQREVASEMQYARGAIYVRSDLQQHTQGCEAFLNVQPREEEAAG